MLETIKRLTLRYIPSSALGRFATFLYVRVRPDERKEVMKLASWLKTLNIQTVLDIT